MGAPPIAWRRASGGYTRAERWSARLADGRAVFIKAAVDAGTSSWLRSEHAFYRRVRGPFLPALLGWDVGDGDDAPILGLEDLGDACWPPPWRPGMVEAVMEALSALQAVPPPADLALPSLETHREELSCWRRVREEPSGFLGLGLCTPGWLDAALPALLEAESAARLEGPSLVHLDIRSDNLCVRDGRAFLVDWNWACVGNPDADAAFWAPTLAAEGGPQPESLLGTAPESGYLAALAAGFWAWNAAKPDIHPGSTLRRHQRTWLRAALHWTARALQLPRP